MGDNGVIGGILGGIADLGNMFNNIYQGQQNLKMSKEQNAWNKDFSERQFQYSQDLQNRIFNREDTAVQRRVADLEGAGFNKLLSLGQGAQAGNIVSSNQASDMSAPQMNMRENKLDNMVNMMNMVYNAMKQKQDIALSKSQQEKIASDIDVNESEAAKNLAEARNKDEDTKYYGQRRNESNAKISDYSSQANHRSYLNDNLSTQNQYLNEQINESKGRQDMNDLQITQNYYDYLMYNALGVPSGSLHYQGKNGLFGTALRKGLGGIESFIQSGNKFNYNRNRR